MTLGAFSTQLPTASVMLMRYADMAAERDLDSTRLAVPALVAAATELRADQPSPATSTP